MRKNEYELAVWRHPLGTDLRWVDARKEHRPEDQESRWLVSAKSYRETLNVILVSDESPASDHELFLKFCRLDETESSILGFARKYGFLNNAGTHVLVRGSGRGSFAGEGLEEWIEEIRSMRDARDLALALETMDKNSLRKWLTIDPKPDSQNILTFRGDGGSTEGFRANVRENRWIRAGKLVLAHRINEKLSGHADIRAVIRNHILERQIKLWSLRAEIWTQLLDAYADNRIYYCAACGTENVQKPHEPGSRKPRNDRELCYDSKTGKTLERCKSRARRQRESARK
jgi:hypothetical protein